ncbi:hypothetical protein MATL_G00088390 [Megalops atlanticus]|uniref:Sperm-associated antigen 8 n=1 Tax=Megalops atlanticus TaxID=7932 RepID=A0A9D3Q368_MEGAT|nr:hypothetical protein MATL_G00088390 [Megalops atlanticus]
MNTDVSVGNQSTGKCLLDNWVEERASAPLDNEESKDFIYKHGHKGILSVDLISKIQDVSTVKEAFIPPVGPGVRQRGLREEILEKSLYKTISEQVHNEFNPGPPKAEFFSTTREDFKVPGFKSVPPSPSTEHDYKREQAISFWSENHQKIQGVTAVRTTDTPFKKNATFSTPLNESLEDSVPYTFADHPDI